jgi:hypothetical protein
LERLIMRHWDHLSGRFHAGGRVVWPGCLKVARIRIEARANQEGIVALKQGRTKETTHTEG